MATHDITQDRGAAASAGRPAHAGSLQRLATETKAAFKTTEFYAFLAVLAGLLIAGNTIEGKDGGTDYFAADKIWLYVTILTVGYMLSRGLAKAGSSEPVLGRARRPREPLATRAATARAARRARRPGARARRGRPSTPSRSSAMRAAMKPIERRAARPVAGSTASVPVGQPGPPRTRARGRRSRA